ncbi:MAG: hypothetical protein AB4042_16085 [Leptolyngbyaceae cyanobacterium]
MVTGKAIAHRRLLRIGATILMKSGIFAVINIGQFRLYVGEPYHLKERWDPILNQLNQGTCKHTALQAEWSKHNGKRNVTFHTVNDLRHETTLICYRQFLKDVQVGQPQG